jgi:molybdopterin converting factor small subunit
MCRVAVPGVLREFTGGSASVPVAHPDGAPLAEVLDTLADGCPGLGRRIRDERGELRRFVNVYVDGEDARRLAGLDTPVPAAAEVRIVPSVAGG